MQRNDLLGRAQLPALLGREGRVALIGQLAQQLLAGTVPDRSAAAFVGGALLAWLEHGGDLERTFLQVSAKAGSHDTPSMLWKRSSRGGPGLKQGEKLAASSTDQGSKQ